MASVWPTWPTLQCGFAMRPTCILLNINNKYNDLPWVFKFYKSKWWSAPVFEVDECYFSELVKEIFNVFGAYVGREISDVNTPFVIAETRHIHSFFDHKLEDLKFLRIIPGFGSVLSRW